MNFVRDESLATNHLSRHELRRDMGVVVLLLLASTPTLGDISSHDQVSCMPFTAIKLRTSLAPLSLLFRRHTTARQEEEHAQRGEDSVKTTGLSEGGGGGNRHSVSLCVLYIVV